MEKYRKLTSDEITKMFNENYDNSNLQKKTRSLVAAAYPKTAYKVIVKVNCEYNDNWYDIEPILIVLDKEFNELEPTKSCDVYDIFSSLTIHGRSGEVEEVIQDFSFFMIAEKSTPDLYVRVD